MSISNTSTPVKTSKAEQRELTRNRMLRAVLEIVVSDGMRAVRHRAVAQKAGVSLGTTTYHFSSIEDLIISAFQFWRACKELTENPYNQKMSKILASYSGKEIPSGDKNTVAAQVYELSVGYLLDQLTGKRDDRLIELAFYHESMLYPSLRELMVQTWDSELEYLELVHRSMGSEFAKDDARITFTLFRQLEQAAVMEGLPELDTQQIRQTLHRHMSLCFAASFPLGS